MRIATFNLESLDLPPKAKVPIEARIPVLRPQIQRLDADILCLQEVNGQHIPGAPERQLAALDEVLRDTPYASFHRCATTGPGGHGVADVHNLVTLSRWPLANIRQVRNDCVPALHYPPATSADPAGGPLHLAFERPILICDVDAPGGPLTVLNVHLRAPLALPIPGQKLGPFVWKSTAAWAEGYALSAWKRAAQALESRILVDRLFDEDPARQILVTGDFNAEDHETP